MTAQAPKRSQSHSVDIDRYLGVEFPEDPITVPATPQSHRPRPTSRPGRASFGFRDSLSAMSNSFVGSRSSSIRLIDRTNTKRSNYTATTTNSTSFLPELYSTPPMPTFQKPDMATPARRKGVESGTPTRIVKSDDSTRQPNSPLATRFRPKMHPALHDEDIREASQLPEAWTVKHDRAICVLDARNYTLPNIVTKIRRTFPELAVPGTQISCATIDRRLRQLDQNIEIDYWRVGLRGIDKDQNNNKTLSPLGAARLDSCSTFVEGRPGPSKPRSQSSTASMTQSPPMSNLDATAANDCIARGQNVVTRGFYTGYRSHVP